MAIKIGAVPKSTVGLAGKKCHATAVIAAHAHNDRMIAGAGGMDKIRWCDIVDMAGGAGGIGGKFAHQAGGITFMSGVARTEWLGTLMTFGTLAGAAERWIAPGRCLCPEMAVDTSASVQVRLRCLSPGRSRVFIFGGQH